MSGFLSVLIGDNSVWPGAGGSYVGPGDVNGAAAIWYGLRGFSAAYAAPGTGHCIDIVDSGGINGATINILTSGDLDTATLGTWITAHGTASVKKIYDQSGNAFHLSTATVGNMPTLTANGIGGAHYCMTFTSASSQQLAVGSGFVQSQPATVALVGWRNGTNSGANNNYLTTNNGPTIYANASANIVNFSAGSPQGKTVSDDAWHSIQGMFSGTSSLAHIDAGSNLTMSPGTDASSSFVIMGAANGAASPLSGKMVEAGIWGSDTSANFAALNTNTATYYGY